MRTSLREFVPIATAGGGAYSACICRTQVSGLAGWRSWKGHEASATLLQLTDRSRLEGGHASPSLAPATWTGVLSSEQFQSSFVFSDNCRPGPDTPSAAGIALRVNAHRQGAAKGMQEELPALPNKPQHWRPERSPGEPAPAHWPAPSCVRTCTECSASGAGGLRRHLISN